MDAFYAAVEVLDNPSLKGRPVIVGGSPESRSVVCSASYEARKFGIRSAMACSFAKRLCPNALFVKPHFTRYIEISRRIREIFSRYTVHIETLALDEAWLDVTVNLHRFTVHRLRFMELGCLNNCSSKFSGRVINLK